MVTQTEEETGTKREYNLEQITQEHQKSTGLIRGMMERLSGKDNYKIEKMGELVAKKNTEYQEAGLTYLENIPEIARPYVVSLHNILISQPGKRFKDTKKGLETCVEELKGVDDKMHDDIFGKDYVPLKTEPKGMYGKLLELNDLRDDYANLLVEIEKECGNINVRMEEIKVKYGQSTSKEERKQYQVSLLAFKFDQDTYGRTQREYASKLRGVELKQKTLRNQLKAIEFTREYIGDCISKVNDQIIVYEGIEQNTDYIKPISELIPKIDNVMNTFTKMGTIFEDHNYDQLKRTAELSNFELKKVSEPGDRTNPLESRLKKKEEDLEKTMERAREINNNPLIDLF